MNPTAVPERATGDPEPGGAATLGRPNVEDLYARYFRYVWRCLRSLGVGDADLDDAIQDLFLVVQRRLPEFDGRVSPRTWLYAIAIRIARRNLERHHRRNAREASHASEAGELASGRDLELQCVHTERLDLAREALMALDETKREVFVLSQIEQFTGPEIAEVTGVPINTVYSRLRLAREAFSAEIQRLEGNHWRSNDPSYR